MQNDYLSNLEKFNKTAIDSAKRLGEINLRTLERLTERQLEATSDYLEGGMEQLKAYGDTKDVQSAIAVQTKLATDMGEKFVEHAKKTAEILSDAKGELTAWVEEGMKAANPAPVAKPAGRKAA